MKLRMWFKSVALVLVLGGSLQTQEIIYLDESKQEESDSGLSDEEETDAYKQMMKSRYIHYKVIKHMSASEKKTYERIMHTINAKFQSITPADMIAIDRITRGTYSIMLLNHVDWNLGSPAKSKEIKQYFAYELETLDTVNKLNNPYERMAHIDRRQVLLSIRMDEGMSNDIPAMLEMLSYKQYFVGESTPAVTK